MGTDLISSIPDELIVFAVAASPVVELRGAVPLALTVMDMTVASAFFWSVIGNTMPVFLVYGFGELWLRWTEGHRGFWHRLTDRTLHRSRHAFKARYSKYGLLALPFFVGIPLPMTGAWTGAIAAFIFGIPFKKSLPLIFVGILIAAVIMTLATTGALSFFRAVIL